MANTTWNPADLLNCTLSLANLRAATTTNTGGARGIASLTGGKNYWEYTYSINTNSLATGIALASGSLSSPAAGVAYVARSNGNIFVNSGGTGATLGIIANASVIGIAVDFTAQLLWMRVAPSGNWNGSGTANPATAAGGISISSISSGPLFAYMSGGTSDAITANFGDSAFTGAVPSGFTAGFPTSGAVAVQARVMVMA